MQVAVCGAIGTVGTLTVHALLGTGVNLALRAGCEREMMQEEAVKAYEGLAVQAMELDYADESSVEAVLSGVERVFLILPWRRGMPQLMRTFLQVAVRCGVRFILKISSSMTDLAHTTQQPLPAVTRDVTDPNTTARTPQQRARTDAQGLTSPLFWLCVVLCSAV